MTASTTDLRAALDVLAGATWRAPLTPIDPG